MNTPALTRFRHPARARMACLSTLVLAGAALLSGCVVAPMAPRGMAYSQPEYVNVPPPAPVYEQVGPPPVAGLVWITGFWVWEMGRHVWRGGHWEAPPRSGARWAPHTWERGGGRGGWHLRRGHWR